MIRFLHGILGLLKATLIVCALMLSLVYLMFHKIDHYHSEIIDWVKVQTGYHIETSSLSTGWQNWRPTIELSDVRWLNAENSTVLTLDHFIVYLDIFSSLRAGRIVSSKVSITGLDVTLLRSKDGSVQIVNNLSEGPPMTLTISEFMRTTQVFIYQSKVRWVDALNTLEPLVFSDIKLKIKATTQRAQLDMIAMISKSYGETLHFLLDLQLGQDAKWTSRCYLEITDLKPDGLLFIAGLTEVDISTLNIVAGQADVRLWFDLTTTHLQRIYGLFLGDNFLFQVDNNPLYIEQLDFSFTAQVGLEDNWAFGLTLLEAHTENGPWPRTRLTGISEVDNDRPYFEIQVDYVALCDLLALFPAVAAQLPSGVNLKPVGELEQLFVSWEPKQGSYNYAFSFYDLELLDISGLSGYLQGNQTSGQLRLLSEQLAYTPKSFKEPVNINQLSAILDWTQHSAEEIQVDFQQVRAQIFGGPIQLDGGFIYQSGNRLSYLDVAAHAEGLALDQLLLACQPILPDSLKKWFHPTAMSGHLKSWDLSLKGDPEKFPFSSSKEGVFSSAASIDNAVLRYAKNWPEVTAINAKVDIQGLEMVATLMAGNLLNTALSNTSVYIEDIFNVDGVANIVSQFSGKTENIIAFINASPLKKQPKLSKLTTLQIFGEMTTTLSLILPFSGKDEVINGAIELVGNKITYTKFGFMLEDIEGIVDFTHNSFSTTAISAIYLNQPVKVNILNEGKTRFSILLTGALDKTFLMEQLTNWWPTSPKKIKAGLTSMVAGQTYFQFQVSTRFNGEWGTRLIFSSNLQGLSSDLPAPFQKTMNQSNPIQVIADIKDNVLQTIDVTYGLGNTILFKRDKVDGLVVTGDILGFDVIEWLRFLTSLPKLEKPEQTPALKLMVDIAVDDLLLSEASFSDTRIQVSSGPSSWLASLSGEALSGVIKGPKDFSQITVQLDKFLPVMCSKGECPQQKEIMLPEAFPALDVSVEQLTIGKLSLNHCSFMAKQVTDGLLFEDISLLYDGLSIEGHGFWKYRQGQHQTSFDVSLNANSLETFFHMFNYKDVIITGGVIELNALVFWPANPIQFSLENSSGTISILVGEGHIDNYDLGAGRFLELLNLRVIQQILSFDFPDVLSKGVGFSKISGSFLLDKGDLNIDYLTVNNSNIDIDFSGRIGLLAQDHDQIATVTPKFSSGLPLVGGVLLGPVGVGAGAVFYILGNLFERPINMGQFIKLKYQIAGDWDAPKISMLKESAKTEKAEVINGQ